MEIILLRNYRDSGKGIGKCLSDRGVRFERFGRNYQTELWRV